MKSTNLNQKILHRPVVLYRRVSTKNQVKQEYKSQLKTVKAKCPKFKLSRVNNKDLKECISGYAEIEKRIATGLGTALRYLKHNPGMIMIVSDADRIARRSDVFEKIKSQGLGHRIFDVSTGKSVNEIIETGEHHRIEESYKAARQACQEGINKRIAAGGSFGNPKITHHKRQASRAKKQNDKQRKDAVLAEVGRQSMMARGKPPCLKAISNALDQQQVRTGQSLHFTTKRLSQFKKRNTGPWNAAATKFQAWMHRIKLVIRSVKIEADNRRRPKRRRMQLEAQSSISKKCACSSERCRSWLVRVDVPVRQLQSRLHFEDSCRGPPLGSV